MSSAALCSTIPRTEPYHHAPAAGQAIAAAILFAGAVGLTVWAGHGAAAPPGAPAPCAAGGSVSSAQLEAATLRIRYADAAATSAAFGGSAYAAAKVGGGDAAAMGSAKAALQAARDELARLCAMTALR